MFLDAVRNLDLKAADILVKKYPKLLDGHISLHYPLGRTYQYRDKQRDLGVETVTEAILSNGTYGQCQFIMKHILSQRLAGPKFSTRSQWKMLQSWYRSHRFRDNHTSACEEGGPEWRRCPLNPDEYRALLLGNILRNHPDRKALWSVIDTQIASGHSRSTKYLKLAIDSSNTEALVELLERGWRVNGSLRHCLDTPLQCALKWERSFGLPIEGLDLLIEMHGVSGPPALQGPLLETHQDIYRKYDDARKQPVVELYRRKMAEAATILREHGGRVSPAGRAVLGWAYILHTLLYAVVLPLVLVYATQGVWHDMSLGQKFGFAYLWTLLSYSFPHVSWLGFDTSPYNWLSESILSGFKYVCFLFHHIGLPYVVVRYGWRPIRSCDYFVDNGRLGSTCVDFTFLLPIVVAGIEAVILLVMFFIHEV